MPQGRVLVVDDHELDRRLSALDLKDAGYTVVEAGNVDDAVEELRRQTFDVIVLDIVMPGVDGLTLLSGLKVTPRVADIPVVMLTANDDIDTELRAMAEGAVSYIVKPAHRDVLVQTVTSVLEKARGA